MNENDGHASPHGQQNRRQRASRCALTTRRSADNLAIAGDDYVATSGTLTFQPDEFSKTISVPIIDNNIYQGFWPAIFNVDLNYSPQSSGETDPVLGTRTAVVIIISDDPVPTASMADVTANERAGTMTLTLMLSHPSS